MSYTSSSSDLARVSSTSSGSASTTATVPGTTPATATATATATGTGTGTGTATAAWPMDVDLDAWLATERQEAPNVVRDALDLSVWSLEGQREQTAVYTHCKNNEKLSFSVRSVTRVAGTVSNVLDCLRMGPDSATQRSFSKLLHARVYLDSEVLHAHTQGSESMAIKWLAFATGKKTLGGKGKEFCVREYCTLLPNPMGTPGNGNSSGNGQVGVVRLESYDGVGARYSIRARSDAFSLSVFEPSAVVVAPTAEDGVVTVTQTLSMRKARSANSVSSGVKALSMRLAQDLVYLQRAVQHTLFQPAALADKRAWVADTDRANCSLCVQSFGMLKRRHHCRVCGEVVCSACSLFKVVASGGDGSSSSGDTSGNEPDGAKVRVCKACLSKSSTEDANANANANANGSDQDAVVPMPTNARSSSQGSNGYGNGSLPYAPTGFKGITLSTVSTSSGTSTSSEDSRPSGDDAAYAKGPSYSEYDSNPALHPPMGPPPPHYQQQPQQPYPYQHQPYQQQYPPQYHQQQPYLPPPHLGHSHNHSHGHGHNALAMSASSSSSSGASRGALRTAFFNVDFEEICLLAMETLQCPMAGIRTDDFELVNYADGRGAAHHRDLPRSLPTFRRMASRGKPCIVLDVSADKRISGEKRHTAKLQFFVGIPLMLDGELIGDLCVADRFPREGIDQKTVEVLMVLGKTVTQYMTSRDYIGDLADFKTQQRVRREQEDGIVAPPPMKEVAF